MPELPEVETVVRGLTKHIIGQTIKDVEILHKKSLLWPASLGRPAPNVLGLRIKNITRRGKGIIINLESKRLPRSARNDKRGMSLLIHLKMTGQLIYIPTRLRSQSSAGLRRLNYGHPTDDFTNKMPSRHTRVIIKLNKGVLYFNDQRLFGWVKILPTAMIASDKFITNLGPEPFITPYTMSTTENGRSSNWQIISTAYLWDITKKRAKSPIKATLLDQSVLTGLGNIYVDEVLFESGIRPTRKSASITKVEAEKLIKAIKKILKLGIKHSGTSIINYKTPEGSMGKMQNHLKVYMQDTRPCKVCKSPILKIRLAGRGTHYCPKCQK